MGRRGAKEGSIYQRSDGRWVAVVDQGYREGKRRRKSLYGRTRAEVGKKLTKALSQVDGGLPLPDDRQSLKQFLERWLEDSVKMTVRPRTYVSYKYLAEKHIVPELGHLRLTRIGPHDIQRLLQRKGEGALSARTVQYIHAVLRRALGRAERWGLVQRNVAKLVEPPSPERHEITPLTPPQARTLLANIREDRSEATIVVALSLGLRLGEVLGLRWVDLDLDKSTLMVSQALQQAGGRRELVELKTRRSKRSLTLPLSTAQALRRRKIQQSADRLRAGSSWTDDVGLVFTTRLGRPLDERRVRRTLKAALERSGLPAIRFHDLRHTAASLLLVQGLHPRVVMETLGHSQISLTMDTYAHVLPALRQEAADKMEALLCEKDNG